MAEAVLGLVRGDTPLRKGLLGLLQHVWQVVGVDVVEHVHRANDLLGVVAEHPLEGGARVPQGAVGVDYRDDLRGVLHDRAQPAVVFPGRPAVMPGLIGTTMRGTVTAVVPVSIRGVNVSLPPLAPLPMSSIPLGPGEGLPRRPSRPNLTVGLQALYHHIPLGLVLPEVTEELFLLGMVLTNSFQASLYPTIYIVWIKGQPEVEDLPIVAMVVPDSCPAGEALFPSPTG